MKITENNDSIILDMILKKKLILFAFNAKTSIFYDNLFICVNPRQLRNILPVLVVLDVPSGFITFSIIFRYVFEQKKLS